MDCASPFLDIIASRLWDCTSKRAVYIRELPENLHSLRNAMAELRQVYADLKEKVDREEELQKKRTHAVDGWIKSVEAMEKEVNDLLAKGDDEIQMKCLGTCCPKNCRASYKIGKMVRAKMEEVASKKIDGVNFSVVAEPLPSPPVIERPSEEMVGSDSFFNHVCMQIQDENVTSLGLYGMGGVGKTTLLNRINNEFFKARNDFDVVIWVTVSRPANVEKVQRVLFNKLSIPSCRWEDRCEDERKEEIFSVLKTKKFALLLDDFWEPLDLLAVGIPPVNDKNKSKLVLTTRFSTVCRDMGARAIAVEGLAWKDAYTLFQKYVGEDTINSHPHIPELAEIVAKECDGLPLALTIMGRAMAGAKTPEEWEKKIHILNKYPEKFPGMEKDLFSRLAFSYDNLQDETTKSCFLYCSLFPEDYEIDCDKLIRLWIGEGFLDEYSDINEARNGGEEIIASLNHACLLEGIFSYPDRPGKRYVKMHDVIRDMALWLVCQNGNKKQNKFIVVDKNEMVYAREFEKWKTAERISLVSAEFEEHVEPPSFSCLKTLLLFDYIGRVPRGFFMHMPNITTLDFTNSKGFYDELPMEIENLTTLQYLNLSNSGIRQIPTGLGNLKRLRCLILDYTPKLKNFPSHIISCLSSLQMFSLINSAYQTKDCSAILEELEGLKSIEEVSISVSNTLSFMTWLNCHKLQRCLNSLHVCDSNMNLLRLFSPHMEKLVVETCSVLEDVVVNFEQEATHSTFPRHQSLSQLSVVSIRGCHNLKTLACLVHAPNLKFLSIGSCRSLEELIGISECGIFEIKSINLSVFSRLSELSLQGLQNLRRICKRNLLFPSLKVMIVLGCPLLKKLPFDSNITRYQHLQEIYGEKAWWEQMEWEDETLESIFAPYFKRL